MSATRLLVLTMCLAALAGIAPAARAAGGPRPLVRWAPPSIIDDVAPFGSTENLAGTACPTSATCLTVGSEGTVLSTTGSTTTATLGVAGDAELQTISCPSATLCVASATRSLISTDDPTDPHPQWTVVSTLGPGAPAIGFPGELPNRSSYAGVSCASTSLCAAWTGNGGLETSTSPAGGPGAWTAQQLPDLAAIGAVACAPGTTQCVASAATSAGVVEMGVTTDSGAHWALSTAPGLTFDSTLDCPSTTLCVGTSARPAVVVTSTDPAAGAASWSAGPVAALGGDSVPQRIVCPSASSCLGLDGAQTLISSTDPSLGAGSYTASAVQAPVGLGVNGVAEGFACPTAPTCVMSGLDLATAHAVLATLTLGSTPTITAVPSVAGRTAIDALSCPSASLCVAGDDAGGLVSSATPSTRAGWQRTVVPAAGTGFGWDGVSCPTTRFCAAITSTPTGPLAATSTQPATPGTWTTTAISFSAQSPILRRAGLSCPGVGLCVAGTQNNHLLVSPDPLADDWSPLTLGLSDRISWTAISCPSARMCVAGDDNANHIAVSTDPAGGRQTWHMVKISSGAPLGAGSGDGPGVLSCPSTHFCLAGDSRGGIDWSTDPTGGTKAWHRSKIAPASIVSVSCRSRRLCVVVDSAQAVYTTADATGPARGWRLVTLAGAGFPAVRDGTGSLTAVDCAPHHACLAGTSFGVVFPGTTAK